VALIARYLIDTSVLARMSQPAVANPVVPLIDAGLVGTCAVLDLEALYGARSAADYEAIRIDRGRAYEYLPTHDEQWQRALDVQRALAARGQLRAVGIGDLLIAATAEHHGVTLIHYDSDIDHVVAITGQRARWVVARGSVS
jgi:predicted nucleic acid-binding protein